MSSYSPPIENVAIFDTINFSAGETVLTQAAADKRYLRFPNAQGTENLQAIVVNGQADFKSTVDINTSLGQTSTTSLSINDTTSNNKIQFIPRASNDTSNPLVDANDMVIIGSSSSNSFTIAPNSSTVCGIRMTDTLLSLRCANASLNLESGSNITAINNKLTVQSLTAAPTSNSQLSVVNGSNIIELISQSNGGYGNPIVNANDNSELSRNGQPLSISCQSSTTSGIRITNSSVLIGAGGTSSNPTTNILFNGTNTIISGAASFTATNPPTSSQTIPAPTDSSNKIPTTAWVQSAISSISNFTPIFKNYTDVQTTSGSGYSNGPTINFNGPWEINDIAYFRIVSQVSYNKDGTGAYQSTGNSMGVMLVRPYYMQGAWGNVSTIIVAYCNNTPASVMGADRKIAYYTPCYNTGGVQNFIITGGVKNMTFGVLSFQANGGWEYYVGIEYMGARCSSGCTVTFSNGTDLNGINNSLP